MPAYYRKSRRSSRAYRPKRQYKRRSYAKRPAYRRKSYAPRYSRARTRHSCSSCSKGSLEKSANQIVKCVRKRGPNDPVCADKVVSYTRKLTAFHPKVTERVAAAESAWIRRDNIKKFKRAQRQGAAPAAAAPAAGEAPPGFDDFQRQQQAQAAEAEAEFQRDEAERAAQRGGPRVDEPMDV